MPHRSRLPIWAPSRRPSSLRPDLIRCGTRLKTTRTACARPGVPVNVLRYDGMIHGFFIMGALVDQTRAAREEVAQALHTAFDSVIEAGQTRRSAT